MFPTPFISHRIQFCFLLLIDSLQWRYSEPDGVSNHQRLDCVLNCLFGCISKKTSKLRVTDLCEGNSPVTGESPAQKARNAENVSIWWRHHFNDFIHYPSVSSIQYSRIPWASPTWVRAMWVVWYSGPYNFKSPLFIWGASGFDCKIKRLLDCLKLRMYVFISNVPSPENDRTNMVWFPCWYVKYDAFKAWWDHVPWDMVINQPDLIYTFTILYMIGPYITGRIIIWQNSGNVWTRKRAILIHWGRVTHICVSKLIGISSDNGLSPGRRQAIIWTNAGLLSIGPLGTNVSEILIKIQSFSFTKMHLKTSSAKRRPFCSGGDELNVYYLDDSLPCYHNWFVIIT